MCRKRVVLLTHDSIYSRVVLDKLRQSEKIEIVGIVLSTAVIKRGKAKIPQYIQLFKKSGFLYSFHLFCTSSLQFVFRLKQQSIKSFSNSKSIPLFETDDINSPSMAYKISRLKPDFTLSFYFNQKIKKEIFSLPGTAPLNIHPAYLPEYRGVDPLLSSILNMEKDIGITVHIVEESLDTGDILHRKKISIDYKQTLASGYMELFKHGGTAAVEIIENFDEYYQKRLKQSGSEGSYYGWPTKTDYKNCLKILKRRKHE